MLTTRCPDLAATSSFTAAASICREFLSTFLAGPVLDSLSESARQVASPGQVSCDWRRAGHVTATSPLIGQESPSSRPRQPSTATLSHASAEMTLSVYKVLAVTANNRWLQYRRSNQLFLHRPLQFI